MKVIVKTPEDKVGEVRDIPKDVETLQNIVGGYIEAVSYKGCLIICNENGKYLGLKPNLKYGNDTLVGTIIVCGSDDEDFTDVPVTLDEWKELIL